MGLHKGWWPKKNTEFLLYMLKNAEGNADLESLDVDSLVIEHIQVNEVLRMQHRTFRAHGWINPHNELSLPHEMIPTEKEQIVPKQEEEVTQKRKTSQGSQRNEPSLLRLLKAAQ